MVPVTTFAGRHVALFGLGGSGLVTTAALQAGGSKVTAWDDNPASVEKANEKDISTQDLRKADWSSFDALILAPGVPLTHPAPHWCVELARAAQIPVIGDVELFSRELDAAGRRAPLIAITGTNGKSTTTALIAHVLAEAGRNVQMGGNIGRAVLDLDPIAQGTDAANQVYVVECSSYQIDLAPSLAPHVGLLLNLTPDHLERHGTMENYAAVKARLVAASDLAVIGADDGWCRSIRDEVVAAGVPCMSISMRDGGGDISAHDGKLIDSNGTMLIDLSGMGSLRGQHNAQNAAAALAACQAVGLSVEEVARGFGNFPGLAHRMEQIGHVDDVLFINDSKATNAEAAAPALTSFEKVRWIAGGLAKEGGIEALEPHFGHIEKAYLIGEAAASFAAQLGDTIPYEISGTVQQAVNHAACDARREGTAMVVLLSPAAASFDQFPNFEKRGEAFRQAVMDLTGFTAIES